MTNARSTLLVTSTIVLGLGAFGCSGDSNGSPTAPSSAPALLELTSADLLVGGQSVSGSVPMGHGMGQQAVFKGTLVMGQMPAPGYEVWVEYDRPMGMMGPHHGKFQLFDDGTNGDAVAGDGIYHFRDHQKAYACNGQGMMAGEYHYQFFGLHADGRETNRMHVKVHLTQN